MNRADKLHVVGDAPLAEVRAFLERDLYRNLFILNDLCEPYAPFAGLRVAVNRHGEIVAAVLRYACPGDESLWPVGSADGVKEILATTTMPDSTVLVCLDDAAGVAGEFLERTGDPIAVQRMVLRRDQFRFTEPGTGFEGQPVLERDYSEIDTLWNGLTTDLFPAGAIFGIQEAGACLCAVAVAMPRSGVPWIGTIGGVHVDPALRGCELGKAVTSLACRHWFESGRERMVLNVAASNVAARAAYRAIGFEDLLQYTVVPVRRRER